ncbi:Sb-PDE family phosphodiesterase [Draconibacterium sp. IB214405]|uniref:Sb-PDE family phosphodiesterase n=1 Tax=Draconibacterium sp. IB214405 TaxID=3097352 RepID=UPI002A16C9DF|nr:Sb-PDE family phosphodiesterase [Draconibacterium sp. IB214405]MDX8337660.1 Sb-PDE family phosphodiesterase [Draconibacterium sp. IB214405]
MIKRQAFFIVMLVLCSELLSAQTRQIINIPDIEGYQTLKCDFHMHTVFSDGTVWPTVRVEEAWKEGLDAISITDHIEYRPHSIDVVADHNRSYDLAKPLADQSEILLIKGTEITRGMPPGHLNALFITNANLLELEDVRAAVKEARDQGAFIMWNHPCWDAQQPDSVVWWDDHSYFFENDMLHGIEVYNWEFCPEAMDWANEKNLTMMGNSDVHDPMEVNGGHRPMTLVFAKSRTIGGIKEALFDGRTAVYYDNTIAGRSEFLEPLFFESLDFSKSPLRLKNKESRVIKITNNSDVDYELELVQPGVGFDAQENITLKAHHVTALSLTGNSDEVANAANLNVYYRIKNMLTGVDESLVITFTFRNN